MTSATSYCLAIGPHGATVRCGVRPSVSYVQTESHSPAVGFPSRTLEEVHIFEKCYVPSALEGVWYHMAWDLRYSIVLGLRPGFVGSSQTAEGLVYVRSACDECRSFPCPQPYWHRINNPVNLCSRVSWYRQCEHSSDCCRWKRWSLTCVEFCHVSF